MEAFKLNPNAPLGQFQTSVKKYSTQLRTLVLSQLMLVWFLAMLYDFQYYSGYVVGMWFIWPLAVVIADIGGRRTQWLTMTAWIAVIAASSGIAWMRDIPLIMIN